MSLSQDAGKFAEAVIVEAGTGRITIYLREGEVPGGGELFLEPDAQQEGFISWSCSASIADKYVPAACRQ